MSIYFADRDVELHLGHVLEVLPTMPAASAHCIVTSPPYYGLRDYGVDGQIGLEQTPQEYIDTMLEVVTELGRVLRPDGTLWLNLGDSYSGKANGGPSFDRHRGHGHAAGVVAAQTNTTAFAPYKSLMMLPERIALAMTSAGWILRNKIVWNKPNAMPESIDDRLMCRYEHVFLFARARRYHFDLDPIRVPHAAGTSARYSAGYKVRTHDEQVNRTHGDGYGAAGVWTMPEGGRNPGDVWTIPTQPFPGAHFAVMPQALARRCILAGCPEGGTVLDPFAGAGTTLLAARQLGRRGVGIELNPAYLDIAVDRIGDPTLDFSEAIAR